MFTVRPFIREILRKSELRIEIREGEIPVFWACGVTPQVTIEIAKPEIVITHAPGHMFITDILNDDIEDALTPYV